MVIQKFPYGIKQFSTEEMENDAKCFKVGYLQKSNCNEINTEFN